MAVFFQELSLYLYDWCQAPHRESAMCQAPHRESATTHVQTILFFASKQYM